MLHAGDGERCNPTLKHVLNSANDPVITHEDIIRKLRAVKLSGLELIRQSKPKQQTYKVSCGAAKQIKVSQMECEV